ncbi:MAG TPA: carbonate dehydratase [Pelomicrobium sp.]|nr:carbonate dehydratase [Pelomicrobium sp.]
MHTILDLFAKNRAWAEGISRQDPAFFDTLSKQQSPRYMWIGCADSRVPANEIVGLLPGEMFVHRNVANVVVHSDLNCLSVIQYAVEVLRVEHVIVCGHYGCGGVQAAWSARPLGLIDNWLRHVQDVAERHASLLDTVDDAAERVDRLCALNVLEQTHHVCRTTIVQDAWRRGQKLAVHGLVYRLRDGILRNLGFNIHGAADVPKCYATALQQIASRAVL